MYTTQGALEIIMTGVDFSGFTGLASLVISRAEARVNSSLAKRYDMTQAYFQTTTATPPQVREWATQLAAGYAWKEISRGGAGKECLERGKSMIKDVMDDLEELVEGSLELLNTTGSIIADSSLGSMTVLCSTSNYFPTIDEGKELNWRPDPDKLSDISDAKS